MKKFVFTIAALAIPTCVLISGCGKKPAATPITVEQAPALISEAFKDAKPEAMAAAKEITTAVQGGDPASLAQAHEFAARADLNEEQRIAAYRVAAAVHQKIVENAARGDKKAQEALEQYRATK